MTWYELDHARLVLEHLRVSQKFPQFVLKRSESRGLYWTGELSLTVGDITPEPLQIRLEYPRSFPAELPKVYVIKPELPPEEVGHQWHRWAAWGTICYLKPKDWQLGTTADEIIEKSADWYFNYVAFKNGLIDKLPEIGRAALSGAQHV
jgi:hypothetical protein